jgi:hypothetical protein
MTRNYRPLVLLYAIFIVLTLIFLVGIVSVLPAGAQEATPEAGVSLPPVVVVSRVSEDTVSQLGTIVVGLLMAFIAGGATVGGGLILFTRRLREQPELARAIERLYLSIPVDKQNTVRQIIVGGKEGFDLAEELTDGDLESPVSSSDQVRPG